MKLFIVGAGLVGRTLAIYWKKSGHEVVGTWNRTEAAARESAQLLEVVTYYDSLPACIKDAEVVLLSVVDDAIGTMRETLRAQELLQPHHILIHCSGALSSSVLGEPSFDGFRGRAALHPLQTISNVFDATKSLSKGFLVIDGDAAGVLAASRLARDISPHIQIIDEKMKVLYHLGAVIGCNLLVALIDSALEVWSHAGIGIEEGKQMLWPLIHGTLSALEQTSAAKALTGPLARGDVATIKLHLQSLEDSLPHLNQLYRSLSLRGLHLTETHQRISRTKISQLRKLLTD